MTEDVPQAIDALARVFTVALRWPEPVWLGQCRAEWSRPVPAPRARVAIPIWRDPWMVVGSRTFTGDLLARLGLANVFADAAGRYPHVTVEHIRQRAPDLVLLPDEPYPFSATDVPDAFPGVACAPVEGRAITWYGPSLLTARDVVASVTPPAR